MKNNTGINLGSAGVSSLLMANWGCSGSNKREKKGHSEVQLWPCISISWLCIIWTRLNFYFKLLPVKSALLSQRQNPEYSAVNIWSWVLTTRSWQSCQNPEDVSVPITQASPLEHSSFSYSMFFHLWDMFLHKKYLNDSLSSSLSHHNNKGLITSVVSTLLLFLAPSACSIFVSYKCLGTPKRRHCALIQQVC